MTDGEVLRDAIELFAVEYFRNTEMAGTVKFHKRERLNYFSFELTDLTWDEDVDKLHSALVEHLRNWAKDSFQSLENYQEMSAIVVEYLLPEKNGAIQNQSRHIRLFHIPASYRSKTTSLTPYPVVVIHFLKFWHNVLLRNAVLVAIPTILAIVISVCEFHSEMFQKRLEKSYDYINVASGIIASFVLAFIIDKVINTRQEKLKYAHEIKKLSNQLTYFRNICYSLARDHNFWTRSNPYYESYEYGISITHDISYLEYRYPNFDDDIQYAKYRSFDKKGVSPNVVSLVLQLHMFADETFLRSGLSFTQFPPDYIYSHNEVNNFSCFTEANEIWYCCSEIKVFPDVLYSSYHITKVLEDLNRIYPERPKVERLTREVLIDLSLDFQYRIIPKLYNLTRLVESDLPLTLRYFTNAFILLLVSGLIIPTLTYIFVNPQYALLSVFIVIGIISHILLSLKPILNTENWLDRENDYL
jgi:hypothetical protein